MMAIYLAALYAVIAHDLDDDYKQAREQGSQQLGREVCISKSDLVRPLLEESVLIACSYLHAAAKSPRHAVALICRRRDVMENYNEYVEALRLILGFVADENDGISTEMFQTSQEHRARELCSEGEPSCSEPHYSNTSGTNIDAAHNPQAHFTVPAELKLLVENTPQLHRYLLPRKAALVVTTSDHLPPAFTLRLLAVTLLEGVACKAASERHRAKGHRLVVERAEENPGRNDRDWLRILEFYTNNRLKVFYSDCYYSRDKATQMAHGKLRSGCKCREVLHIAIKT